VQVALFCPYFSIKLMHMLLLTNVIVYVLYNYMYTVWETYLKQHFRMNSTDSYLKL